MTAAALPAPRHRLRNVVLVVVVGLIALAAIGAAVGGNRSSSSPASSNALTKAEADQMIHDVTAAAARGDCVTLVGIVKAADLSDPLWTIVASQASTDATVIGCQP